MLAALAMSLAMTAAVVSCTTDDSKFEYLRLQVDGQPTLAISQKDLFIRGVVIYFHGVDEDEFALTSGGARRSMTDELLNAGFAVVASRAGGNAFTDPATLQNYRELGSMAREHYRIDNIYFLAESMGSIAAISLLASNFTPVRGLAAIDPELDTAADPPAWPSGVDQHAKPAVLGDPMSIGPEFLRGKNLKLYVNQQDPGSKSVASVEAFRKRFDSVANISVDTCSTKSSDDSCFQGADIAKWFTQLG